MDTFLCILKAIVSYFILMLVGTNLIGIVVRGIRPTHKRNSGGDLASVVDTSSNNSRIMTVIFFVIIVIYFYALYHYWNFGILAAGIILMLSLIHI